MKVLKVRQLGNSNVVVIPHELEALGYTPGASVVVDPQPDGTLHILPADRLRDVIRDLGQRVVQEDREALDILATHDQGGGPDLGA